MTGLIVRLVLLVMLILGIATCYGCATPNYLHEAIGCGHGAECNEAWDAWNKNEIVKLEREAALAYKVACKAAGGQLVEFRGKTQCVDSAEMKSFWEWAFEGKL